MPAAARNTTIAVIMPAYNEAVVIGRVIKDITAILTAQKCRFRIIVVDDSSRDDTAKIAEQAGCHVIRHILNTGTGGATATGLSYACQSGFDIAATIDADGQHNPKDLLQGIELMRTGDSDLLIGSRLIDASGMSRVKLLGNKGLSTITYLIFGINVTDSQSGLRIFSKKSLDRLKWKTSGYEFCSEMLWRAKQQHLRIGEYPVQAIYTEYSNKKGQNNWNGVNIVKSLLRRRVLELFGE